MPRGLTPSQAQIAFSAGMPTAAVIEGYNFPPTEVVGYLVERGREGTYILEEFDPKKPNAKFPKVSRLPVLPKSLRLVELNWPNRPPELPKQKQVIVKKEPENRQVNSELHSGSAIRQILNPTAPFKRPYGKSYKRF